MAGDRTLVLGGARSGKSRFAEGLLDAAAPARYVATGYPPGSDQEWAARVRAHQERRPAPWRTVETVELEPVLADASTPVLLDCLSLWLARVMDDTGAWAGTGAAELDRRLQALVAAWTDAAGTVVAVSNEVGLGVVPETAAGRAYRDRLGELNQRIAAASEQVWLVVAGIPVRVK